MQIKLSFYSIILVSTLLVLIVRLSQMIVVSRRELSKITQNWDFYPTAGTLFFLVYSMILIIIKYCISGSFRVEWLQSLIRAFGVGVIIVIFSGALYESLISKKIIKTSRNNFYASLIIAALCFSMYTFFDFIFL